MPVISLQVMAGQFHSQMEERNRELERLEQRLRETMDMLAQTNADKQSQLTDHQLTMEEIQSATSINAQVLKVTDTSLFCILVQIYKECMSLYKSHLD